MLENAFESQRPMSTVSREGGGVTQVSKIRACAIQIVKVPPINPEKFLKSIPINPEKFLKSIPINPEKFLKSTTHKSGEISQKYTHKSGNAKTAHQ